MTINKGYKIKGKTFKLIGNKEAKKIVGKLKPKKGIIPFIFGRREGLGSPEIKRRKN